MKIVGVVFNAGNANLGATMRSGHFAGLLITEIRPSHSETLGKLIEIVCTSESGNVGGIIGIPMDQIEGLEYCHEGSVEFACKNYDRFVEELEARRKTAPSGVMPMPEDFREFIEGLAKENGMTMSDGAQMRQEPDAPVDDDE